MLQARVDSLAQLAGKAAGQPLARSAAARQSR
jgi:hypothetical protein